MSKSLFIAEKPSVAKEFARVLKLNARQGDGYLEAQNTIVTWCVGHLVTMSYPEVYDEALKKWSLNTLPFFPENDVYKYEVIPAVKKQFQIVSELLNREDVDTIYVCTDSGREGEYIYRLVDQMAKVSDTKKKLRVWIDSQTEEEIIRGIKEAKPISEYDTVAASAYLRAKEDYLMGINFSRVLSLKYGNWMQNMLKEKKYSAVAVGRVMTCVLGMVVKREWEIRKFVETPFYRVLADFRHADKCFTGEWKAVEGSKYYASPALYKENGFKEKEVALGMISELMEEGSSPEAVDGQTEVSAVVEKVEKKKEKKNPPLLFNLAEIQNLSSKLFKISPEETLKIIQELYEKKLVTYPRTDARVLSSAVAKEIVKNLNGLRGYALTGSYVEEILRQGMYQGLEKTRYVNDKQITDHYAIIPTGQGLSALNSLSATSVKMYEVIVRRFLSIFYPAAEYQKVNVTVKRLNESFFTTSKVLVKEGFLPVSQFSFVKTKEKDVNPSEENPSEETLDSEAGAQVLLELKKGMTVTTIGMNIKEGKTSPPKRYSSGSIILAMENAGQLIEDEELRAQIKGSGIGTSATRAGILEKLFNISYMKLNKKTQIITPTLKGELVYAIVFASIPSMLDPTLTASWEKGLTGVAEGSVTEEDYMAKLKAFVTKWVNQSSRGDERRRLEGYYREAEGYYKTRR